MVLSIVSILILALVIVVTAILSRYDLNKNTDNKVENNLEVGETDIVSEESYELKPQDSFEYILNIYFSEKDYNLNFLFVYKRLLEKAGEIPYDVSNRDAYHDIVSRFFHGCMNFERKRPQKLFDEDYGEINRDKLESLELLNENLLQSVIKSAERALDRKQYLRIFEIDVEFLYMVMQYYSFVAKNKDEYVRVRKVLRRLVKHEKIGCIICDIYVANLSRDTRKIQDYIAECLNEKTDTEDLYELGSALKWMGRTDRRILKYVKNR